MFRELSEAGTELLISVCDNDVIDIKNALDMLVGYDDELYNDVTEELRTALSDGEWGFAIPACGGMLLFASWSDYVTAMNQK